MAVGYSPITLSAVRPLPIVYPKPDEIIVLSLYPLPLFPVDLPYSSPQPFVKTFNFAFHIRNGIISKPACCIFLYSFEYILNWPCLFSACQLSDFILEPLDTFTVWAYSCFLPCFVQWKPEKFEFQVTSYLTFLLTFCNSAVHHCTVWVGVNLSVLRPIARPPRLRTLTFLSYIRHIYIAEFGQYWTLLC